MRDGADIEALDSLCQMLLNKPLDRSDPLVHEYDNPARTMYFTGQGCTITALVKFGSINQLSIRFFPGRDDSKKGELCIPTFKHIQCYSLYCVSYPSVRFHFSSECSYVHIEDSPKLMHLYCNEDYPLHVPVSDLYLYDSLPTIHEFAQCIVVAVVLRKTGELGDRIKCSRLCNAGWVRVHADYPFTIDFSDVTDIKRLDLSGLSDEEIDLSGQKYLESLTLNDSNIYRLDLSKNRCLLSISLDDNKRLEEVIFPTGAGSMLQYATLRDNNISTINLDGQRELKHFSIGGPVIKKVEGTESLRSLQNYDINCRNLKFIDLSASEIV